MKEYLGRLGIDDHQEMFYIEASDPFLGHYRIVYTTGPRVGKNALISTGQALRYIHEYAAWRRRIDFSGGFR